VENWDFAMSLANKGDLMDKYERVAEILILLELH
jgi:hypothetical protein